MASVRSSQIKFMLVLTCMVSLHIVESVEPIPGQPLLQFSPDQATEQKFLLEYWKDCHDAWLHTGGCLVDILKILGGGIAGGLPGGLPLGNPPPADAPGAAAPGGSPAADTLLDGDDAGADAGGGGGFPDIGSWFPGLGGGGLPGLGAGIPGVGGLAPGVGGGIPGIGGLPGLGAPFSQVCCDSLSIVQKSCPGLELNPFYGPLVSRHCAAN